MTYEGLLVGCSWCFDFFTPLSGQHSAASCTATASQKGGNLCKINSSSTEASMAEAADKAAGTEEKKQEGFSSVPLPGSSTKSTEIVTTGHPTTASPAADTTSTSVIQHKKTSTSSSSNTSSMDDKADKGGGLSKSIEANTTTSNPLETRKDKSVPVTTTNLPSDNTGNDRVSVDKLRGPLASEGATTPQQKDASKGVTSKNQLAPQDTNQNNKVLRKSDQIASVPSSSAKKAVSDQSLGGIKACSAKTASDSRNGLSSSAQQNPQLKHKSSTIALSSHDMGLAPVRSKESLGASQTGAISSAIDSYSNRSASGDFTSLANETEGAIRRLRAPLVDKYSPYIIHSDTSLEMARKRLRTALDQTRQLRAAFTDRVYSKYRVCLKPPPQTEEILETLKQDPRGMYKKLQTEMKRIKTEKETEKKDSAKGSNDNGATDNSTPRIGEQDSKSPSDLPAASNADSSDALMYVTSGLSLIVLPESNAMGIDMSVYNERGPFDPSSGQRARGISAAAATAGEKILQQARRGQTLRAERERKRSREQLEDSRQVPLPHHYFDSHYCQNQVATLDASDATSTALPPPTATFPGISQKPLSLTVESLKDSGKSSVAKKVGTTITPSKPAVVHSAANAKAIRARVQATMSMNTLLSLNPIHEELRNDTKFSASTIAIMERGVGTQTIHTAQHHKNTPHRFKHPFPNSLGGRRRTISSGASDSGISVVALPNIPTAKERRQHRRISVLKRSEAATSRSKLAIQRTLRQFDDSLQRKTSDPSAPPNKKRRITEIDFFHGLSDNRTASSQPPMDPSLVLNVMKAVGLLASSTTVIQKESPLNPSTRISALFDEAKMKSAGVPVDSGPFFDSLTKLRALESTFATGEPLSTKPEGDSHPKVDSRTSDKEKTGSTGVVEGSSVEPVSLRGGGGEVATSAGEGQEQPKLSPAGTENGDKTTIVQNTQAAGALPTRSSGSMQNQAMTAATSGYQNFLWNERSQQPVVLLPAAQMMSNANGASQGRNGQQQLLPEHFHQTNALQLAHQLRMSRISNGGHPTAGDLAEYIGGLHPQQAAYDWSAVGAASAAAAVASSHSFAALGFNQHRHTMVPLTVQNQARALLTRDQQNMAAQAAVAAQRQQQALAMLGGTASGPNPYAAPGYPQLAGHLLNQSAAAFMGQNGIQRMALQAGAKNLPSSTVHAEHTKSNSEEKQPTEKKDPDNEKPLDKHAIEPEKGSRSIHPSQPNQPITAKMGEKRKLPLVPKDEDGQINKRNRPNSVADAKDPSINKDPRPTSSEKIQPTPPNLNGTGLSSDYDGNKSKAGTGLKFFVPPSPECLSGDVVAHVLAGRCHDAIAQPLLAMPGEEGTRLVNYIIAVGFAVPIPKAMIMHRLKDRMNHPLFKTGGAGGLPASSREAVVAEIMIWLWRNNEGCFQRAFAKSGRIDVDVECKWFVDAAVNTAVSALSDQITQELSNRAPTSLVSAIISHKSKCIPGKSVQACDSENLRASATKIDLLATLCVSRALNMSFALNHHMDEMLPTFHDQISYLDEARKCALYCKSQERALLAGIVSRKATMSFSFSHSYVSAMVRAGEALGHGSLFEAVQNERYGVSTMIPYDVFTDESYAWEDPCRPALGFSAGLTGDEMMRRAHARAMIQKSLKKLQERHNIKGGTPISGPYMDQGAASTSNSLSKTGSTTPRGTTQRRRSFSDAPIHQGSGAAAATSSSLYDPKHSCPSLEWKADDADNSPYGRHNKDTRTRSLSIAQGAAVMRLSGKGGKGLRRQNSGRQNSGDVEQIPVSSKKGEEQSTGTRKSTNEIPWKDVAGIFQQVQLPGTMKEKQEVETKKLLVKDITIFAPVVRKRISTPDADNEDSSDEEDLSDEAVLARHQVVLNEMKEKLTAIQESRKKLQDRRKSRDKSHK